MSVHLTHPPSPFYNCFPLLTNPPCSPSFALVIYSSWRFLFVIQGSPLSIRDEESFLERGKGKQMSVRLTCININHLFQILISTGPGQT